MNISFPKESKHEIHIHEIKGNQVLNKIRDKLINSQFKLFKYGDVFLVCNR